jgi:hypothetical protein
MSSVNFQVGVVLLVISGFVLILQVHPPAGAVIMHYAPDQIHNSYGKFEESTLNNDLLPRFGTLNP